MKKHYEELGWDVIGDSGEDFGAVIAKERATWEAAIRGWGLRLD